MANPAVRAAVNERRAALNTYAYLRAKAALEHVNRARLERFQAPLTLGQFVSLVLEKHLPAPEQDHTFSFNGE